MSPLQVVLISVLVILFVLYVISRRRYDYWRRRSVPYLEPTTLLGNYGPFLFLKETQGETAKNICTQLPDEPVIGAFFGTEPALIVQDPEILKLIMTKDFYYFNGREVSEHSQKELFTKVIFFIDGDRWRVIRQNLTPIFSSAKMKNMFYLIEHCSKLFETILDEEVDKDNVLNIRDVLARYFMDCIGSTLFGVETKALEKPDNNVFVKVGDQILEKSKQRAVNLNLRAIWPKIFYGLGLKVFSLQAESFFKNLLSKVYSDRRESGARRNDFIDLMLDLKQSEFFIGDSIHNMKTLGKEKAKFGIDDELLIAHSMGFFAAGYETSASTTMFVLYELAKSPDAQAKAAEEIDAYLKVRNNKLQYDCISELPYLQQCMMETMRLYPVLGLLTREVYEDYRLPNGLLLEKGLRIHVPVMHMHRNPKYFSDPDEFKPERFSDKNNIIPYTYMPFGEGPRTCIGMRPAKMQVMAGLVTLLKKYRVGLAPDMPRRVRLEATAMVLQSAQPIRLTLTPRDGWEERRLA